MHNIAYYYYAQNMYIEVCLLKYLFKATSYLNDTIIEYRHTIFNQFNIMLPYVDMIGLCHSLAIL